jgi:RNA polymerase-binding transcription factor DksA
MHYHYFTLEQRNTLAEIMAGLPEAQRQALHQADYGVCEACGGDIPYVKLLAEPLARRCPACNG